MKLVLKPEEIAYPDGLEIAVEGFAGDAGGVKPSQLFIELHEGRLKVHVWTTGDPDPTISMEIQPLPPQPSESSEHPQGNTCHT
jgi:hypothetical protein